MNFKHLLSVAVVCAAACAFAEVTITLDRVQQRYPWNGLVDVDYTIEGIEGDANDYTVTVGWESLSVGGVGTAARFDNLAGCDLPTANGAHRVTWNAAADGLDFSAKDFKVTVRLDSAPVTEQEADYMIIDVSAGNNAAAYPVRFVATGADYSTENFNHHLYKQSKVVLKKVHAGEFWMGENNVSKGTGETRHRVLLTDDYWLGIFETTEGQINCVTGVVKSDYKTDSATELAVERPECHISYDATMHPTDGMISRLNLRAQCRGALLEGFDLPSEAEWEYACRAGTETKYSWGSDSADAADDYAWGAGNANSMTHAVGLKLPNAWGFYDMYGNVGEWCRDWAYNYPLYSATHVSTNPVGRVWNRTKVLRGGSYHASFGIKTSGGREMGQTWPNQTGGGYNPSYASQFGFRLCKALTSDAVLDADPVTMASASATDLKIDFRQALVRKIIKLEELFPLAWNSSATWAKGGDAGVTAALRIVLASGEDKEDPTAWVDGGVEPLEAGAGEGTAIWVPTQASLARAELTVGATVVNGYFDLTECEDLEKGMSIADFSATLADIDLSCDGYAKTPKVTLKDKDGNELVEGVDYSVTYSSNLNVGTATVTIAGIGEYEGVITKTFNIVPMQPQPRAASGAGEGTIDTRVADDVALPVAMWRNLPTLVFNDTKYWDRDGDTNELNMVRVTLDRLDDEGVPTGELITVLDEANGEGEAGWRRLKAGGYLAVSAMYKKDKATDKNWTLAGTNAVRRIDVNGQPGMLLLVR